MGVLKKAGKKIEEIIKEEVTDKRKSGKEGKN